VTAEALLLAVDKKLKGEEVQASDFKAIQVEVQKVEQQNEVKRLLERQKEEQQNLDVALKVRTTHGTPNPYAPIPSCCQLLHTYILMLYIFKSGQTSKGATSPAEATPAEKG